MQMLRNSSPSPARSPSVSMDRAVLESLQASGADGEDAEMAMMHNLAQFGEDQPSEDGRTSVGSRTVPLTAQLEALGYSQTDAAFAAEASGGSMDKALEFLGPQRPAGMGGRAPPEPQQPPEESAQGGLYGGSGDGGEALREAMALSMQQEDLPPLMMRDAEEHAAASQHREDANYHDDAALAEAMRLSMAPMGESKEQMVQQLVEALGVSHEQASMAVEATGGKSMEAAAELLL